MTAEPSLWIWAIPATITASALVASLAEGSLLTPMNLVVLAAAGSMTLPGLTLLVTRARFAPAMAVSAGNDLIRIGVCRAISLPQSKRRKQEPDPNRRIRLDSARTE